VEKPFWTAVHVENWKTSLGIEATILRGRNCSSILWNIERYCRSLEVLFRNSPSGSVENLVCCLIGKTAVKGSVLRLGERRVLQGLASRSGILFLLYSVIRVGLEGIGASSR
jgi:hypothetical protein